MDIMLVQFNVSKSVGIRNILKVASGKNTEPTSIAAFTQLG